MNKSITMPKIKKEKKKKKKKNRCSYKDCNKKLKISDMPCANCQKKYCALHRVKTQHECPIFEVVNKDTFIEKYGLAGRKFKKIESI